MGPSAGFPFGRILVLCEGNHCRSPMAEGLLQAALGPGVVVESAGIGALVGKGAHEEVLRLMAMRGLDLLHHQGRQLTVPMALSADLILVMDRLQKMECERAIPSARGRVFLLGKWLPPPRQEIPDPFRSGPEAFELALTHIDQAVAAWLPRLVPPVRRP
jgi:protein-tyrosine phosphatase